MALFGIDIQTKIVLDESITSGSMTPKIDIDLEDPQKIAKCIADSKEQVKQYITPTGVETFTDPETGIIGYYEPGTNTKVLVTSIDLPLIGNVYKDGEWKGAAGKIIQAYVLSNNQSSAVAAKIKFDTKKAMSAFTKSLSSKFHAATGSFSTKNLTNGANDWWKTNKETLLGGLSDQVSEITATIETKCDAINTIWSGEDKNTNSNGKTVTESGEIKQDLDKASEDVDKNNTATEQVSTINTTAAMEALKNRSEQYIRILAKEKDQQNKGDTDK